MKLENAEDLADAGLDLASELGSLPVTVLDTGAMSCKDEPLVPPEDTPPHAQVSSQSAPSPSPASTLGSRASSIPSGQALDVST